MIHVSHLTKYYGDYPAVHDICFDVAAGQIVGFLGPNGAGKTTTMRISGRLQHRHLRQGDHRRPRRFLALGRSSPQDRLHAGKLPALPEMRVGEYLHFRAGIKGIYGWERRERIDYVLERCWLTDVARQIIGTLSKGYRQRVGLADALFAESAGADPRRTDRRARPDANPLRARLIRELGQQHTILLSTHILSEVEATCDRVIIIHRGKVAVSSSLDEFKAKAGSTARLVLLVGGRGDPNVFRAFRACSICASPALRSAMSSNYASRPATWNRWRRA